MVQIFQSNEEGHELFPIKIRARMNEIWIDYEELQTISDYYLSLIKKPRKHEHNSHPEAPG